MLLLEEMKNQQFDLHMDGTKRGSQKIVGHQITLKNGKQMSMGFSALDRETADSLIDTYDDELDARDVSQDNRRGNRHCRERTVPPYGIDHDRQSSHYEMCWKEVVSTEGRDVAR